MRTISFDLDGVLFDFTSGFRRMARKIDPSVKVFGGGAQQTWLFEDISKETVNATWEAIHETKGHFWSGLALCITPAEKFDLKQTAAYDETDIIYVTNRPHLSNELEHTRIAIASQGLPIGQVIFTPHKAATLKQVDFLVGHLEDSPANIIELQTVDVPVYIRDWAYNRRIASYKQQRVGSVTEFLYQIGAL